MKSNYLIYLLLLPLILFTSCQKQGFLHTEGTKIVDANNQEVILRGMGLGGWMLQEGYMLETSRFAGPQHKIKETIEELVGTEAMENFYNEWHKNYCTKKDVDTMAAWGFNSIRLPMHYNLFTLPIEEEPIPGEDTWLDKGFDMVDDLLKWCAANQMYLILDLHAAPGGQGKDANISDYDTTKPSLWESEENRRKTYALWRKLAERYKNEPWMGAYDILNEPNWDFDNAGNKNGCNCEENQLLWEFYENAIQAIREVDQNHIVIIEGNCWGNNYKGVPDPKLYDDNLVMSFHKYWNFNTLNEIEHILNYRKDFNVPVWLGESGENSNTWFTNAIALLESNKIGWAWWPYKKINSVTGTVTIPKTHGYQNLLDYWNGKTEQPNVDDAKKWLMEQAEMMKLENCIIHYDVTDAMFRQAQGDKSAKPFKTTIVPATVFCSDYDLGANNFAYFDTDTANYRVSGVYSGWNNGRKYRNDGVDIESCEDEISNGFGVGWTENGEWLQYTIHSTEDANYQFAVRYKNKGKISLQVNNQTSEVISLSENEQWNTAILGKFNLNAGENTVKINIEEGGLNLNYLTMN